MPSFVFCRSIVKFEPILFRQRNRRALRKGELRVIEIRRAKPGSASHHLHQKMKDGFERRAKGQSYAGCGAIRFSEIYPTDLRQQVCKSFFT